MEEAHNDRQRKQTHGHGGVARYRCPFTIPGRWHARGSGGSVISFLSPTSIGVLLRLYIWPLYCTTGTRIL